MFGLQPHVFVGGDPDTIQMATQSTFGAFGAVSATRTQSTVASDFFVLVFDEITWRDWCNVHEGLSVQVPQ